MHGLHLFAVERLAKLSPMCHLGEPVATGETGAHLRTRVFCRGARGTPLVAVLQDGVTEGIGSRRVHALEECLEP